VKDLERIDLEEEHFVTSAQGVFMMASLRCSICNLAAGYPGGFQPDRDLAAEDCMRLVHMSGWKRTSKGVVCPECQADW
jgi:hypothetical protein